MADTTLLERQVSSFGSLRPHLDFSADGRAAPQRLQGGSETTAQFKAIIATESENWRLVTKDLGITMAE
jgi:hypothetical protein